MDKKVLFGAAFVILAFGFMVFDALDHIEIKDRFSMAFVHGSGGGHGGHGAERLTVGPVDFSDVYQYPLRGPDDAIERLPFVEKDGVKEFRLSVDEIRWEYAEGKYVHAWAYNGQVPGPEIRVDQGDRVRVIVTNNLPVETTVHWHGMHVPNDQDGVPEFTQFPIKPGAVYTYEWTATNAGTKFYHTHGAPDVPTVTQLDMGLSGPLIVNPENETEEFDKEFTFILDEWGIDSDGFNRAITDLVGGHEHSGAAYNVFTMNGRTYPDIPFMEVEEGDRVRIRLINAGTSDVHPMHLHGHSFRVIATDGNPVPRGAQLTYDTFTVHPSEKVDIAFVADNPGSWLFHCHHLHHADAGMKVGILYDGHEPCCFESSNVAEGDQ